MIPFPNVIAGILIGAVNTPWSAVLIASLGWGAIWCVWVRIRKIHGARTAFLRAEGQRLLLGSPILTFWAIEWVIGASTALLVGTAVYLAKALVL